MNKIIHKLFNRLFITVLLIILQLAILLFAITFLLEFFIVIRVIFQIISIILVIFILNHSMSPSAKMPWMLLILIFPVLAGVLFFMAFDNKTRKHYKEHRMFIKDHFSKYEQQNNKIINDVLQVDPYVASQSNYILKHANHPLETNTTFRYYDVGEKMFHDMITDLKNAKQFIFLEYFIINEGYMFTTIIDILKEKAMSGLDVRLVYDDIGCLGLIPYDTYKQLAKFNIKTYRFNPFRPILSIKHNTRDHRKICVVDGYIGYTGGLNIADEYINKINRFGHWKDTAIRFYGEGVSQLTLMFLETWTFYSKEEIDIDSYLPNKYTDEKFKSDGYLQIYGDSPLNSELLGQSVYINILNQAIDYVYIFTPYLIVDNEMIFTLCLAAKRGIDVRIVLPFHPDKWYVHLESRSYYPRLIEAGVKIYEYTPGFMHAKSFLADDKIGVIGTINLDYRSLYHHFENGVYLYNASILKDLKIDYLNTFTVSQIVTIDMYKESSTIKRLIGSIMKFFSPLM